MLCRSQYLTRNIVLKHKEVWNSQSNRLSPRSYKVQRKKKLDFNSNVYEQFYTLSEPTKDEQICIDEVTFQVLYNNHCFQSIVALTYFYLF